jgi:hypothetical protein
MWPRLTMTAAPPTDRAEPTNLGPLERVNSTTGRTHRGDRQFFDLLGLSSNPLKSLNNPGKPANSRVRILPAVLPMATVGAEFRGAAHGA